MAKLTKKAFPSALPSWLADWAIECESTNLDNVQLDDLHYYPTREKESLLRTLKEPNVAADLLALDDSQNTPEARDKIKILLSEACHLLAHSRGITPATPSMFAKEMRSLASAADKLAGKISEHEHFLWPSTNLVYLTERATTEAPKGFMLDHRAGLRSVRYPKDLSTPGLVEMLEAFAADIKEELSSFPQRIEGLDGGRDAHLRFQIRFILRIYKNLFGEPNYEAIARLLSRMNDKEIDADRIRKSDRH